MPRTTLAWSSRTGESCWAPSRSRSSGDERARSPDRPGRSTRSGSVTSVRQAPPSGRRQRFARIASGHRARLGTVCLAVPSGAAALRCQWASLDVVSGGGTLLCVCMGASGGEGMGEARREVEMMAFDPRERVGRSRRASRLCGSCGWGDAISDHGEFFWFVRTPAPEPKPIQKPCLIWIAEQPVAAASRDRGRARIGGWRGLLTGG